MNAVARFLVLFGALAMAAACAMRSPLAGDTGGPPQANHEENRILVTFRDERVDRVPVVNPISSYRQRGNYRNSTLSERIAGELAQKYGIHRVAQWPITTLGIHCVVYEIPQDRPVDSVLRQLAGDETVEAVQTMKRFRTMGKTYSDPYFRLQTGLRTAKIGAIHAWATGRNVRIAVIDTGVDESHPDLAGQLERSENLVPDSGAASDDIHGTAVAGVIAASADNGQGIVGIAPGSKIIALKACWQKGPLEPEAVCNSFTLASALNTAIERGADVINMSLSGPNDPLLERLIAKAVERKIIVVASEPATATGDNGFPASMAQVIAVRTARAGPAVEAGMEPRPRSVAAPGVEVLTTLPHGTYNFMTGSSFAAAHVSGVIALMLEVNPALRREEIVATLNASTMPQVTPAAHIGSIDACLAVASVRGSGSCAEPGATAVGYTALSQPKKL